MSWGVDVGAGDTITAVAVIASEKHVVNATVIPLFHALPVSNPSPGVRMPGLKTPRLLTTKSDISR